MSSTPPNNNKKANTAAAAAAAAPPSVSDIRYWIEGSSWWNGDKNEFGDDNATYLSYDVFLGLSVLGGFFALDHLYLRSPWTFLAKFFVNIFCFGIWWFYDAIQAIFNTDTVRIFGLSVPGLGPMGIAAGVLANPEHSKKHWRFFTYAVALFFGGIFGMDSFLVGDRQSGVMRLVALLSMVGLPIALLWWAYKVFQFFTNTKSVVGQYSTYFGGAAGGDFSSSLFGWLFSPVEWLKKTLSVIAEPVILPITDTIQAVTGTVDKTVDTIGKSIDLGREAISKGSEVVEQVTQGMSSAASVVPGAALYASVTPEAVQKAVQQGGGASENLNALPFVLLVTLLLISVTGFIRTFLQSSPPKKQSKQNDVPPEPVNH
jgi:hypothetical protein